MRFQMESHFFVSFFSPLPWGGEGGGSLVRSRTGNSLGNDEVADSVEFIGRCFFESGDGRFAVDGVDHDALGRDFLEGGEPTTNGFVVIIDS